MTAELEKNPKNAEKFYMNQYVIISGVLNDYDIEADWFDIRDVDDDEGELLLTCTTPENDDIYNAVKETPLETKVTVKGQIIGVSRDYGYDILVVSYEKQ